MTKEKKIVEKTDLMNPEIYLKGRKEYRKELLEYKKK